MALFPKCTFAVSLARPVVAGGHLQGTVVMTAPEDIPRAEAVELVFQTEARAVYGSGKNRSVKRATLFSKALGSRLAGILEKGTHELPFDIELPPWLPPALEGGRCSIQHSMGVRLDVDWAIDPDASFAPVIALPPRRTAATPTLIRSGQSVHATMIVEIGLRSTTVVQGGALEGSIAVRGAEGQSLEGLELAIVDHATVTFARGDRRALKEARYRWPAEKLRGGASVPFRVTVDPSFPPTFRNGYIDHDLMLEVRLIVPWRRDPAFSIPLEVLPAGSNVEGDSGELIVGNERMRAIARSMARERGLSEGRYPVLVEGTFGPVSARLVDSPKASTPGIEVELTFPSVDLGLTLRPRGLLDLGGASLLPEGLTAAYVLRRAAIPGAAPVAEQAVSSFIAAVTRDLEHAAELRLSDHRLAFRVPLPTDGEAEYRAVARQAIEKAEQVWRAIAALPAPAAVGDNIRAWHALASEQSAFSVPCQPAVVGVVVASRVLGGEERSLRATLRSVWEEARPVGVEWDVDLGAMPLPSAARARLAEQPLAEAAPALSAHFVEIEAEEVGAVTLRAEGWRDDPRGWLEGLEAFFAWTLEERGERTSQSAYR